MKKNFCFLMILLMLFCFIGCNEQYSTPPEKLYKSVTCGGSNSVIWLPRESDVWAEGYFYKSDIPDKTCEIFGKSYTGTYESSIIHEMTSFVTDQYCDPNGIEFSFRSDTDELVFISYMNMEYFDTEPYLEDVAEPKKKAIEIGTDAAKEFVDDINDYVRIDHDSKTNSKEKDGKTYQITYYYMTFARKICGYLTSDCISVAVTSKGHIAAISIGELDAFKNATVNCDNSSLEKSINDKISSEFEKKYPEAEVKEIVFEDQVIVKTPDGDIAMLSNVSITVLMGDLKAEERTGVKILTVLDYRYIK